MLLKWYFFVLQTDTSRSPEPTIDHESHHSSARFWFRLEDHARRYVDQAHSFLVSGAFFGAVPDLKFQMSMSYRAHQVVHVGG